MLELLILYVLNKQEQTLYGLRKTIAKHFGEISIPSHGALHPCIKKLEDKDLISVRKKLSDGGKKYTYYSIKSSFPEYFNNKFMEFNNADSETLDAFLFWLKVHLYTIDIVNQSNIEEFKEKVIYKLDNFKTKAEEKLNNEYIELTKVQKKVITIQLKEIYDFKDIINDL